MYVCILICIHAHVCMDAYMKCVCIYINTYMGLPTCAHVHKYILIYAYMHMIQALSTGAVPRSGGGTASLI